MSKARTCLCGALVLLLHLAVLVACGSKKAAGADAGDGTSPAADQQVQPEQQVQPDDGRAQSLDLDSPVDGKQPDAKPTPDGASSTCPCPLEQICDLNTMTCKPGCQSDTDCLPQNYCDPASMLCKPGCRDDAGCGPTKICEQHQCVTGCRNCVDDGNPCTDDYCDQGVCVHPPVGDGTACKDDGLTCTEDKCSKGVCAHPAVADGKWCGDGKACLTGACLVLKFQCAYGTSSGATGWILSQWGSTGFWPTNVGGKACSCTGNIFDYTDHLSRLAVYQYPCKTCVALSTDKRYCW